MSEVDPVQGGEGVQKHTQDELKRYQQDYQKRARSFQKSFHEYTKPNVEVHKKEQLKKVMDEALQVMNETACVALKEGKIDNEKDLNAHYQSFIANPTEENQQKVAENLKSFNNKYCCLNFALKVGTLKARIKRDGKGYSTLVLVSWIRNLIE